VQPIKERRNTPKSAHTQQHTHLHHALEPLLLGLELLHLLVVAAAAAAPDAADFDGRRAACGAECG
jgi:hypothetical protein